MRKSHVIWIMGFATALFTVRLGAMVSAEPPPVQPASKYAPAQDLLKQFDYFVARISEDVADEAEYGQDQQARVARDASTVAALALVLGKHDQENRLRRRSAAVIEAATKMTFAADDYQQAQAALRELQAAIGGGEQDASAKWAAVGSLEMLMQQVPILNTSLRRGITGRNFERAIEKNAQYAATLAAISQASLFDTDYCTDQASEVAWREVCAEMRDAAAEVNRAVRDKDQAAAQVGLAKLAETCETCHHKFRD